MSVAKSSRLHLPHPQKGPHSLKQLTEDYPGCVRPGNDSMTFVLLILQSVFAEGADIVCSSSFLAHVMSRNRTSAQVRVLPIK